MSDFGEIRKTVDPSAANLPADLLELYDMMNRELAIVHGLPTSTEQVAHLLYSREAIGAAAQTALRSTPAGQTRSAFLLGVGRGWDSPVEQIVSEFDHTTFLDIETTQTEEALSKLPSNLLGKVSLVQADLTGIAGQLVATAQESLDAAGSFADFARTAPHAIRLIRPDMESHLRGQYSFVCSHLVMSQLLANPWQFVRERVQQKFGQTLSREVGLPEVSLPDEALALVIGGLTGQLQQRHLSHLNKWVEPTGAVHFADTFARSAKMNTTAPEDFLPMLYPEITEDMAVLFPNATPQNHWFWHNRGGDRYVIASFTLLPWAAQ